MTLINNGTIAAIGTHALVVDTGTNVLTNAGTLEATGSGGLIVNSDVANSGLIWANGGNITINGAVTGSGECDDQRRRNSRIGRRVAPPTSPSERMRLAL